MKHGKQKGSTQMRRYRLHNDKAEGSRQHHRVRQPGLSSSQSGSFITLS